MDGPTNYLVSFLGVGMMFIVFVVLLGWTLSVCARDARRRGKSPLLVTLLIFLSFPLGLIVWLLFRPEPLNPPDRSFHLKDHQVQ